MKGVAKIDIMILGAYTVATLSIAGLFYYTTFMAKKTLPKEKENFAKLTEKPKNIVHMTGMPLKRILVNLPARTARLRFLELEISLFPFKEKQKAKLEALKPILKDTIIDVSSKMEPDELNSISGKILLEERIKRAFHQKIDEKLISKIFYTKFVVQ